MTHRKLVKLMGQKVTVTKVLTRDYKRTPDGGEYRFWRDCGVFKEPRPGWVVGIRTIQEGEYVRGGWEEQAGLTIKGTKKCLLIAFWPTENAVRVPLDGFREWKEEDGEPFCSSWGMTRSFREKNIKRYKEDAEQGGWFFRDEKGRFMNEYDYREKQKDDV